MTEEQFGTLKEEFIKNVKEYFIENGEIPPHISVFGSTKDPQDEEEMKPALIHVPIPEDMMHDDEGKDKFIDDVFPEIAKTIKKKFNTSAIAWTSEAWVRTIDKIKNPEGINNWKKLPIEKEVVIIAIESEHGNECAIYDVIRDGHVVTSSGDIKSNISLAENKEFSKPEEIRGRFAGLFSKLKD